MIDDLDGIIDNNSWDILLNDFVQETMAGIEPANRNFANSGLPTWRHRQALFRAITSKLTCCQVNFASNDALRGILSVARTISS